MSSSPSSSDQAPLWRGLKQVMQLPAAPWTLPLKDLGVRNFPLVSEPTAEWTE